MSSPYPRDFGLLAKILAMRKEQVGRLEERREQWKKRRMATCRAPGQIHPSTRPSFRPAPAASDGSGRVEVKQEPQGSSPAPQKGAIEKQGGDNHEG